MPTFIDLGLPQSIQEKLEHLGIQTPSSIQALAIPRLLEGKPALIHAQTGSGKTLAYVLPMLERLTQETAAPSDGPATPGGLILVPTQELGLQVRDVVKQLGWDVVALIGGANPARQAEALKKRPRVVVGTPGRVLQMIRDGKLSGRLVRVLVGDEADQLFEAAHREDLDHLLKATSPSRQTVLVTATAGANLREWLPDAEILRVVDELILPSTLTHQAFVVEGRERVEMVRKIVRHLNPKGAIAFVSRPSDVDWWVNKLKHHHLNVEGLHSGIPKLKRASTMRDFKSGKLQLLLATELASRGLDLGGVSLVINMELPSSPEQYVHRVGRTARMGRAGIAVTLATPKENFVLQKLERSLGITFERPVLKAGEIREATADDLKLQARKAKHEERKAEEKAEIKERIAAGEVIRAPKKVKKKAPTARQLEKGKAKKALKKARAAATRKYRTEQRALKGEPTAPASES